MVFWLDYYGFGTQQCSYYILTHGCNTIIGFGAGLSHSSWLAGCPVLDLYQLSISEHINQIQPHAYNYVVLSRGVGYMPLGNPCNCIMAIVKHSKAVWPFILTAYLAL